MRARHLIDDVKWVKHMFEAEKAIDKKEKEETADWNDASSCNTRL